MKPLPDFRMSTPPTPMGSGGLLRYRSAPSSYLVSLLSSPTRDLGDDFAQLFHPDTQRVIDADCLQHTASSPPTLGRHTSLPDGFFDGAMYEGGMVDEERPREEEQSASELIVLQRDSVVPCKIRAKRGCATHPRSIAERVRRSKISERMRKLQDLVPNMDKQTSTSDMLDFAVEYIKDLRRQVQTLSDDRANCSCSCSKTVRDR